MTDSPITLELTTEEARLVSRALDTYIRVFLGQCSAIMDPLLFRGGARVDGRTLLDTEIDAIRRKLFDAQELLTGVRHGGPGIFSDRVPDAARRVALIQARLDGDVDRGALYRRALELPSTEEGE